MTETNRVAPRKIAVTGGLGRVGSVVVAAARAQGHDVLCIDRATPPHSSTRPGFAIGDVRDYAWLRSAVDGCDALVHLAGHPNPDLEPSWTVHNDNVVGSYNALLAAADAGIESVVLASSVNYYGLLYSGTPRLDYLPLDEEHPTYNNDPYSLSKVVMEEQARSVARKHPSMRIAALRFHWVVPSPPSPTSFEPDRSASQLWGYVTSDDAARACLAALRTPPGFEAYLVVSDTTFLEEDSVSLARRYFPTSELRRPLRGNEGLFDVGKAADLLGWEPVGRPVSDVADGADGRDESAEDESAASALSR